MISQQIAPLGVRDIDPGSVTADAGGYAECSDGQSYVLKPASLHPLLPATEAFCETLGIACQLPVTVGAWIRLPDGTECYGSRWEGGLVRPLAPGGLVPRRSCPPAAAGDAAQAPVATLQRSGHRHGHVRL